MSTKQKNKYGTPSNGCYLDQANYNNDDLSREICAIALGYGWTLSADDQAILDAGADDDERSDGPSADLSEQLDSLSRSAIDWLNEQETRPFMYWANEGEAGAFGLWVNVDGAKEDCGFVSGQESADNTNSDFDYPPDDYRGEWLHVNDHGNATLYVRESVNPAGFERIDKIRGDIKDLETLKELFSSEDHNEETLKGYDLTIDTLPAYVGGLTFRLGELSDSLANSIAFTDREIWSVV